MTTVIGYDGNPRTEEGTYETCIRVRYARATDFSGSRFIVTNLRTSKRQVIGFNYSADDPARDAAGKAFDVQPTDISWTGATSDGTDYYLARLPLSD